MSLIFHFARLMGVCPQPSVTGSDGRCLPGGSVLGTLADSRESPSPVQHGLIRGSLALTHRL